MKLQSLSGAWHLEILGESAFAGELIPAHVPGSVYGTLLELGKIPDPFWRDNELEALRLMDCDFVYSRNFDLAVAELGEVLLICEGLDTLCDITLNGVKVGYTDNMHRIWEFDISTVLRPKNNELRLTFYSPTKYIARQHAELFVDGTGDAMKGFPQIRKAHCMFGWDWGPRLPDAGIWRDISLAYVANDRLDDVSVLQDHQADDSVTLHFKIAQTGGESIAITLYGPDGSKWNSNGEPIVITTPQLWWPNGYGSQPLYTITISLLKAGQTVDVWERRIGLRTMTMACEKDEWGESFCHRINGIDIFAMGADYIPQDNILSRISDETIRVLLEDCVAANYNSIRVWGGGYYPDHRFFDICDELGLVVWQDFMFSCAIYELTPEFEANIRAEVADNVKRLRHHASLGLWCGNNELEWAHQEKWYVATPKQNADYIKMFEYIIPQELKKYDSQTFYWPASPSSGGGFDEPNDADRGDAHYWQVWHGGKPFSEYRKFFFRYASEFGFQSFPCLKTVESFTLPEDRNIFSRIMEMHQRNAGANGKIMGYLAGTFRYPTNFATLLYASQLLQAEAIKYGVEHWRRNRGRCMGAIYWQINDIWPVASWASIDYFGRWKALHYYAKRFFAPIMLSCEEIGEMTERPSCVAEYEPIRKSARLAVANETRNAVNGKVQWALRNQFAEILKSGEQNVSVNALSSLWLEDMDFSDCDELSHYFSYELEVEGVRVSGGTVLFCMPKHYNFVDPKLSVTQKDNFLTITAAAYAKSVEIYSNTEDFLLSDNFFDINGDSVTVEILRGDVKEIQLRSVFDC
ncbi:MAG: glycoside hydrolase family 2 protein [Lachnospiraceae bacterium]|nr:glycoside hydrolase family 2 protein [Lachnospiraceae bacterium]